MAVQNFGNSSSQNVNIWSTLTFREALKKTLTAKLMGDGGKTAIINKFTELEKSAGDTIKYDLLMQMTGAGVTGDNRMRDNEETLTYHQDSLVIDQLRNAHAFRRMSQQRTLHSMREDAKSNLADWWAGIFDTYLMDYLCGNTLRNHGQAATAPDGDHYILSGDVAKTDVIATDEASLTSNDQFTLADIDYCVELATTITPPMRPTNVDGGEYWVVVLHPYSVVDLRLDIANSAYVTWPDVQMYANKRGLNNPLFTGALGVYNGCILYQSTRIYNSTNATTADTVRRNLFLGAQAGVFAVGSAYDSIEKERVGKNNLMSWYEQTDDFGNEKAISVGCIFGMKNTVFNSKDYGKIVICSYAIKHSD